MASAKLNRIIKSLSDLEAEELEDLREVIDDKLNAIAEDEGVPDGRDSDDEDEDDEDE